MTTAGAPLRTQEYFDAYQEGLSAAKAGRHFNDSCPYTYEKTGAHGFDRQKLNGWFDGWYSVRGPRR